MPNLHHFYAQVDSEWYESFDRYSPDDEFLRVVRPLLPTTWRIQRDGVWFGVHPPTSSQLPRQGWKIHVSAVPEDSKHVLHQVAIICVKHETPFKFALDKHLLRLMNSKGWSRPASGKFITIYPIGDTFSMLLRELYDPLKRYKGPYILSDRRYRDSRVLYYRYGTIHGADILTVTGERQQMFLSPDGNLVPDVRSAYWNPPLWATDPFEPTRANSSHEDNVRLKYGRYTITKAIGFSVNGGAYVAEDNATNSPVFIKEARPFVTMDGNGQDAKDTLRKEFRLLQMLQETGVCPRPIDLFDEWEHAFLVQEYVEGLHLGQFCTSSNPIVLNNLSTEEIHKYRKKLFTIWTNLALALKSIHESGIILGDLSLTNVLVSDTDTGAIRVIDLEAAWIKGRQKPSAFFTPGFASPTLNISARDERDDIYSLGSIMLGMLMPVNNLLELDPSLKNALCDEYGEALLLSKRVRRLITNCMSPDPKDRPPLEKVIEVLRDPKTKRTYSHRKDSKHQLPREELLATVNGVVEYIQSTIDTTREDRIAPADPSVFFTNPLSVAYGAAGISLGLYGMTGKVPKKIVSWMLAKGFNPDQCPPGLYVGLAGIAWAFWEMGLGAEAQYALTAAHEHPLLHTNPNLFLGSAGYGLTCLRMYVDSGDEFLLAKAVQVGEKLMRSRLENEKGYYWRDEEGKTWLGYARGASGIALFFLYLSIATNDPEFLEIGRGALAFDLAHTEDVHDGVLSVPRGHIDGLLPVYSPYWLDGSAGIAAVVLRYWLATKDADYLNTLERLTRDISRKHTVFPGLFQGLAGLGHVLLDVYDATRNPKYLRQALDVADGISLFALQRSNGIVFPGEQLLRISTDFGTGAAGIGLYLHRLAHAGSVGNPNFFVDALLRDKLPQNDTHLGIAIHS